MAANKARGFVSIELPGGSYTLGLSLDTLAVLEDEFKVEKFEDAFALVGSNAKTNKRFFYCIFAGSGYDLTDEVKRDIGSMTIPDAANLLNDLMVAGGMKSAPSEEATGPLDQDSQGATAGKSG
jgi:hypothetical protein